ncbi:hypothetical protein [Streptomyces sp. NPDC058086]|uniref:hypothetical protein n=1 Tax=Streptomyces sp. NPDC058086 TaxID=3346334 RepID=UPI0036E5F25B
MLHDAVLPGAQPTSKICPECWCDLGWKADGFIPWSRHRLEDAYKDALDEKTSTLLRQLNSTRHAVNHERVRQQPCRFRHLPPWLLAQCRTPEEVDKWLERLHRWWTPPQPPNAS